MEEIKNEINDKIDDINNRYNYLIDNYNGKFNKMLLLYDDIKTKLDEVNILMDNFEVDSKNDLKIDLEIEERINDNIKQKEILKVFSPYILLYQLNRNNI